MSFGSACERVEGKSVGFCGTSLDVVNWSFPMASLDVQSRFTHINGADHPYIQLRAKLNCQDPAQCDQVDKSLN